MSKNQAIKIKKQVITEVVDVNDNNDASDIYEEIDKKCEIILTKIKKRKLKNINQ